MQKMAPTDASPSSPNHKVLKLSMVASSGCTIVENSNLHVYGKDGWFVAAGGVFKDETIAGLGSELDLGAIFTPAVPARGRMIDLPDNDPRSTRGARNEPPLR